MKHRMFPRTMLISVVLGTVCSFFTTLPDTNYTSQTAIFTQPAYHNIALWSGAWDLLLTRKKCTTPFQLALQVVPFYQKGVNNDKARSYFSLNCKDVLIVAGDQSTQAQSRDIRSEWLGITDPTFEGRLTMQPRQHQAGVLVSINQNFSAWTDLSFFQSWWLDVTIPIFEVRNELNTNGSSPEVIMAFNNNSMEIGQQLAFARIVNAPVKKTGVGTIEVRLGGNFLDKNHFFLDYYSGIGIPCEGKPCPSRLFPTTLGNQGHWILINGGHFKMPLVCFESGDALQLFLSIENLYYLHNHQLRTFDLWNKQYSRYLPVRKFGQTDTIPAANVLTQNVRVKPNSFVNLSTGIALSTDWMQWEIGYLLWSHSGEHVSRPRGCCAKGVPGYMLYGIADTSNPTSTATASMSTIATLAPADPFFVNIKSTDIEYRSGAARHSAVQGFHTAIYFSHEYAERTLITGIGGFYMSANNNAALDNWAIWLKLASDF